MCNAAGVVITACEPVIEQEHSFPELDAFRAAPGDLTVLQALAAVLVERGDPIGGHIQNTIDLDQLPRESPRFAELTRSVADAEARECDRMISLLWPKPLIGIKSIYFRRGLPVRVTLDARELSRFAPALWRRAPIDEAHVARSWRT